MLFSRAGECSGDPICKLGDYTAGAKRCGSREGSRGLVCGPEALKPFLFKGLGASDEVKIFSCGSGILPRGYRGWKPLPQRWQFIRDRMASRTIPGFLCAFRGGLAGVRRHETETRIETRQPPAGDRIGRVAAGFGCDGGLDAVLEV